MRGREYDRAKVKIIGLGILGRLVSKGALLGATERAVQLLGNHTGDLALDPEDVVELAVANSRPTGARRPRHQEADAPRRGV